MRVGSGHICIFLFVLFAFSLVSCNRAKVIPKRKLVDVYVDLYIADQWLRDHNQERKKADTTLFYDPVLREHGYTFEDYDKSLNYYAANPDKLADVLSKATEKLKKMANDLEAPDDSEEAVWTPVYYEDQDFDSDSLWFEEFIFWPVADSLHLSDTLLVPDSLHVLDSLHGLDSLDVLHSLQVSDSVQVHDALLHFDSTKEEIPFAEPVNPRLHSIRPSAVKEEEEVLMMQEPEPKRAVKK